MLYLILVAQLALLAIATLQAIRVPGSRGKVLVTLGFFGTFSAEYQVHAHTTTPVTSLAIVVVDVILATQIRSRARPRAAASMDDDAQRSSLPDDPRRP